MKKWKEIREEMYFKLIKCEDTISEQDRKIKKLRIILFNNLQTMTDIVERADRITTGNISHNINWLKEIGKNMCKQIKEVLEIV